MDLDFQRLERLTSTPGAFLQELEAIAISEGVETGLFALRLSGLCVDLYGTPRHKQLYLQSLEVLRRYDNLEPSGVVSFSREVGTLDAACRAFRTLRVSTGVESLPAKRQISAYLIAVEVFLGSLIEYGLGKDPVDIKSRYPFFVGVADGDGQLVSAEEVHQHIATQIDSLSASTGQVLHYFRNRGIPCTGSRLTISAGDLRTARSHVFLSDMWDLIIEALDSWRYFRASITEDDSVIQIKPKPPEEYLAWKASFARFINKRVKWAQEHGQADVSPRDSLTPLLPPIGFRSNKEEMAAAYCKHFFSESSLDREYLGVPLSAWIRGYSMLSDAGQAMLDQRSRVAPLSLRDWCLMKTPEDWTSFFTSGGICDQHAAIIVEQLTFGPPSEDLIDCPLIKIDEYLVALPSVVSVTEVGFSLFSNLIRKNADLASRGPAFETELKAELSLAGISAGSLRGKSGGAEYQCDVAFALENTLYLCECKAYAQPRTARQYKRFQQELVKAAAQLNRIASYFKANLPLARGQLQLPPEWSPTRLVPLVICTPMLGRLTKIQNCQVVDDSALTVFLRRDTPGFQLGRLRITAPCPYFEGPITEEKMQCFLDEYPHERLAKMRFKEFTHDISLGELLLHFSSFTSAVSDITPVSDDLITAIARTLGISEAEVRERAGL